jgi:hypothetical protein
MRILGGSRMGSLRPRRGVAPTALGALCALCAAGPAQASFTQEGSPMQVATDPYGVVAADWNGDGRVDVATVNGTSSNLSVLLRQAAGGFAQEAGSPFAVGSGPGYGAVADFNGDGRPDVATGNFVAGSVSVLLRGAGGGFAAEAPAPFVASASSVAAADFNGDGLVDIAAPGLNTATVTTLLRQPGGNFASEGTTPTGTNPRDVAAADFNGDGRPDLAITNLGSASVTILLRQAGGGFAQEAGSPIPVGASPEGIEAADVNGDRLPDLAVAILGTNTVTVLLRQAGGGFVQEAPIPVGAGALGVASADFDGDGRPDLAVTNNTAGTVTVLLRQAAGGFAPDASSPLAAPSANGVAAADFNGDGRPDIAASGDGPDTLTVFLNTTPPPAAAPQGPAAPAPPVPGKSVVVRVVSGQVFVKYPPGYTPRAVGPAKGFVPLTGAANIPVGSQVDTKNGRVALTSAADTGGVKVQSSDFYQGIFQVKQTVPKKKPKKPAALTTDLVMKGQIARSQCAPLKGARAAAVDAKKKKKGPKSVLGKLWGNGKGKFRTSGRYSSATVRGTIWLVQDRCDGTLTKVTRGSVRVRDLRRKKTVTVKAGHSYLARAQRAATKSRRRG